MSCLDCLFTKPSPSFTCFCARSRRRVRVCVCELCVYIREISAFGFWYPGEPYIAVAVTTISSTCVVCHYRATTNEGVLLCVYVFIRDKIMGMCI